jgi:hypothetical protein
LENNEAGISSFDAGTGGSEDLTTCVYSRFNNGNSYTYIETKQTGVQIKTGPDLTSIGTQIATFANNAFTPPYNAGITFYQILGFSNFQRGIRNNETAINMAGGGTNLTITGDGLTFRNYKLTYTGTTTTTSTYVFNSVPNNARYVIIVYNGGTGNVIFNGQGTQGTANAVRVGGGGINTFTIPTLRFALCNFYKSRTQIGALEVDNYFLQFTLM